MLKFPGIKNTVCLHRSSIFAFISSIIYDRKKFLAIRGFMGFMHTTLWYNVNNTQYTTFIPGNVTVRIFEQFGTKLEKTVPLS